jgi:peptidylprolyl isomerase
VPASDRSRVGVRAAAVFASALLTTAGVASGSAGATVGTAAAKGHHARGLPVVENASDLAKEPVIHGTKGKPPTKLLLKNLVVGKGQEVTASSMVSVKYVGANYRTGKDFTTATWRSGKPATFPLSDVVKGFAEGLVGMRVGGRREIVIPPALGYGDQSRGPILPNETLVFVVDLEGVSS